MSVAGRMFRTKICFVSVGASVVEQRLTRRLLATAARLATYRSFRDRDSLAAAVSMGMAKESDRVYPDLVFGLANPGVSSELTGVVGVGVMAYYGGPGERDRADDIHADYTAKMTRLVLDLVDSGRSVRLVVGDADDEPVALGILAAVRTSWRGPGRPPAEYDRPHSIDDVMRQLALVDEVVGTRFHTVLTALKLAKPTVAVAYGNKHVSLMADMGVGEYVQDINDLDVDVLEKQLDALIADRAHIVRTLAERSRSAARQVDDQFAALSAVIFKDVG
ncbi:polysaccharide pyruvyl transferase family protein [Kribbella sp. NPDC004138]